MLLFLFRQDMKKGVAKFATPYILWTSQGLNLGPPDYETNLVIFRDSLQPVTVLMFSELYFYNFHRNSQNTPN